MLDVKGEPRMIVFACTFIYVSPGLAPAAALKLLEQQMQLVGTNKRKWLAEARVAAVLGSCPL